MTSAILLAAAGAIGGGVYSSSPLCAAFLAVSPRPRSKPFAGGRPTASHASPPRGPWSCVAEEVTNGAAVDGDEDGDGDGDGGENHRPPLSPREWMESIEKSEGTGGGAYTVIRCDLTLDSTAGGDGNASDSRITIETGGGSLPVKKNKWRVWGDDFHLNRMRTSYRELIAMEGSVVGDDALNAATEKSEGFMKDLLSGAELALTAAESSANVDRDHHGVGLVNIVMLTLFWSPDRSGPLSRNADDAIIVRGHAFSSGLPSSPSHTPDSIVANLALPVLDQWSSLPNRCESSPEAKLSSWCRIRRPLEKWYKLEGTGEVLLTRPLSRNQRGVGDAEILEGLTSNLFVVYADGTLRTAGDGVLGGYARDLVLRCATEIGMKVDTDSPILLSDALEGVWDEVFVTSSVRLIVPVRQVLAPGSYFRSATREHAIDEQGEGTWQPIWSERTKESRYLWRKIYDNLTTYSDEVEASA